MKLLILICCLLLTIKPATSCTKITQPLFNASDYYHQAIDVKSSEELHQLLNQLIRNHSYYSYSPCAWEILKEADRHPDVENAVIGFYTRRPIDFANRDYGQNTPDAWNREHIWPKSHGFTNKAQYAYTDAHALRASDKSVNADRGNKDFGNGGSPHSECMGCYTTSQTWQPPVEVVGDTARMMFYMDVRYNGGDNSGTGDLLLRNALTDEGSLQMGKLCDLLQWHVNDPVSAAELQRNDIVYSWQGNRNPFIDHPEFAVKIWGKACGISLPDIEPPVPNNIDENIPLPIWFYGLLFLLITQTKRRQLYCKSLKQQYQN